MAARGIRLAAFVLDTTIVIVLLVALLVFGQLTGVWNEYLVVAVPALVFIYYVSVVVWLTDGLTSARRRATSVSDGQNEPW